TAVSCDGCVIAPLAGRALVRVEGVDTEESARQLVLWSPAADAKPTFYANVGPTLMEVQPSGMERMAPLPFDQERWLAFTHERASASPFVRLRFAVAPAVERLARSAPADFRVRPPDASRPDADATTAGAVID